MDFALDYARGFYLSIAFYIGAICCVFWVQRMRWRRNKRRGKGRLRFYPTSASLGNALHTLQQIAEPKVEYVLEEKLQEAGDEDDESGPKDPTAHLHRQLKRIRKGEKVDRLTIHR